MRANTAATPVILPPDSEVTLVSHEQFSAEINYRAALSVARAMLEKGVIDEQEYCEIDTILTAKYRPVFSELYR
jgi:transcription initiation factor IIE alpha subunit